MRTAEGITRQQARQLDRVAQEILGIPSIILMENAGIAVAEEVCRFLTEARRRTCEAQVTDYVNGGGILHPALPVAIICGKGNNGGDGFVVARQLVNRRIPVCVWLLSRIEDLKGDAATNALIALKMDIPILEVLSEDKLERDVLGSCALIVDAIFGTGLTGVVEGLPRAAIEMINSVGLPVVAVDIPSGLDADNGVPLGVAVKATRTVTFVAPKVGFSKKGAAAYLGEVVVANIGVSFDALSRAKKKVF